MFFTSLTAYPSSTDVRKRARQIRPIPRNRAAVRDARGKLKADLHAFLVKQAQVLAERLGEALQLGKAAGSKGPVDDLDLGDWQALVEVAAPLLADVMLDGGLQGLAQIGVQPGGREAGLRRRAETWARSRAAAMVGMKWVDEELVPNPDAQWQITEGTRDMLRGLVVDALDQGWSTAELADAMAESYAFSETRAEVIARTETARADSEGALDGYRASSVVTGKRWLTAQDDRVSEECVANEKAGVIALDDDFPGGVASPPQHPQCRCVVLPVLDDGKEQQR